MKTELPKSSNDKTAADLLLEMGQLPPDYKPTIVKLNLAEQQGLVTLIQAREQAIQRVNEIQRRLDDSQKSVIESRQIDPTSHSWSLDTETWSLVGSFLPKARAVGTEERILELAGVTQEPEKKMKSTVKKDESEESLKTDASSDENSLPEKDAFFDGSKSDEKVLEVSEDADKSENGKVEK